MQSFVRSRHIRYYRCAPLKLWTTSFRVASYHQYSHYHRRHDHRAEHGNHALIISKNYSSISLDTTFTVFDRRLVSSRCRTIGGAIPAIPLKTLLAYGRYVGVCPFEAATQYCTPDASRPHCVRGPVVHGRDGESVSNDGVSDGVVVWEHESGEVALVYVREIGNVDD